MSYCEHIDATYLYTHIVYIRFKINSMNSFNLFSLQLQWAGIVFSILIILGYILYN